MPARLAVVLAALLVMASTAARAFEADARKLARFDVGYARCEQMDAQMRGQRDRAYLSLYRAPADQAALARLAKVRQSAAYRQEHRRFGKESTGPAAKPASSPIGQQCRALWSETQRMPPIKTP